MNLRRNSRNTAASAGLPEGYDDSDGAFFIPLELRDTYATTPSELSAQSIEDRAQKIATIDASERIKAEHEARESSRPAYDTSKPLNPFSPGHAQRLRNAVDAAMQSNGEHYRARAQHGDRLARTIQAHQRAVEVHARAEKARAENTCPVCGRVDPTTGGRAVVTMYASYRSCLSCAEVVDAALRDRRRAELDEQAVARAQEVAASLPLNAVS